MTRKSMTKKKQTAMSGIYKENWYCNSIPSANKNWNTLVNSRTGTFNRCTLKRRNCGELQEDSNIPSKRILRSTHVTECQSVKVLQKKYNCERNTSASAILRIRKGNKKLSAIKTSNVNIKEKATLKPDVQSRTCKSNHRHCNLHDSNGINRKQNTKFQQENLLAYETNLSQRKSLKPKSHKNIAHNQSNAGNIPSSIVESNWERDYTTSIQSRRKGNCETIKSITTEESNKFRLQIKGKERKDHLNHAAGKYETCNKKIEKKIYSKRMVKEKVNANNSPTVTTARSSKIGRKINKNTAMRGSCIGSKRLIIPLIRTDDLPLSELSKLIQPSKLARVKQNIQRKKNVYFETRNITETQCSTYKQYRTNGNLKRDEEINILYKSVFERRTRCFSRRKEIDANKFKLEERNTYKMSKMENKVNTTETLRECESESTNLLENILQLFLKNRRNNTAYMKTRQKSKIDTRTKKCVAMCGKCAEVFDLLRQFSGKINFMQNEKLCIECTLCNVQINSLLDFQQHVMDIHLQCKRKSSGWKTKFPVVIVNLNGQINVDRGGQFIFECCCCSRIFDRATDFEEHINKMHRCTSDIKRECKSKQTAKSSELTYATTEFKNEQQVVEDETCAFENERYVELDISTNVDGISNQIITKENLEIIENVRRLNIDEKYGNGISRIAITSKSEQLGNIPSYIEINQRIKAYHRHKRYSFSCNICLKRYKRKHMFLSHMSKHVRGGEQRKTQQSNNPLITTFDNDLVLNSNVKTCQGYIDSFEDDDDDDTSNPTVNLNGLKQNTLISKMIDKNKEVSNSIEHDGSMGYVTKEDSNKSNKIDDYSYLLRINITQKTEEGTKRQKSIKFDINVARKYKTSSSSEQQNIENEIENKRPAKSNFETRNASFAMDTKIVDKKKDESGACKKRRCNVCDKKFSSLTILKEHMFILHDSLLEDPELSNLPTTMLPRCFNDNRNNNRIQNLSKADTYTLEEKRDLSRRGGMPTCKKMLGNDGEEAVCQTFNTDKKNRKWRCTACKENFALLRNYLRHKYYCHNDESVVHICDNCNKILTSVAMVNIHTCANVTSWICKRCNLNFSSGVCLTRHNMNCHLEKVGPHICKICKFSFLTAYMLTKHEATHSNT